MLLEKDLKKLCLEVAYPVVSTIDGRISIPESEQLPDMLVI